MFVRTKPKIYIYSLAILFTFFFVIYNFSQMDIEPIKILENVKNTGLLKKNSKSSYVVTSFRIVVLTWKRPNSLTRLLNSLQISSYEWPGSPQIPLYLDIHIDGGGDGADKNSTILVAQQFNCTFATKNVTIYSENRGLRGAWMGSCLENKTGEFCFIAEDDIELSPQWFRFLINMWTAFSNRSDLAGISLEKQTVRRRWTGPVKGSKIVDPFPVFMYRVVGSHGFSPNPVLWTRFVQEQKNITDPRIKGLTSNDHWKAGTSNVWTVYFLWWCEKYDLYTLYPNNDNKVLSRTWNEKGVHSSGAIKPSFSLVNQWTVAWDYNNITQDINYYSFDIDRVSRKPLFSNMTTGNSI